MEHIDTLVSVWNEEMLKESKSPWMKRLAGGELGVAHYKGFLLETYHNAGQNPQLQAYSTMFLKNNPRETIKKFFLHASSEIAHDLLALNDLVNLGVKKELVLNSKPLPATLGFFGNIMYQIQLMNPLSYLGYLFHLEYTPVQNGRNIINMLKTKGVPNNALTFLEEHSTVDVGHTKLMINYLEDLIKTPDDLDSIVYSLKSCVYLHHRVLESAFENGEKIFG
jgi:pyrroloquinoline quinone (PQQ) biosynthesis protein C